MPKEMNELVMIPIELLHQHPDNPRKDLGDLTELTDSIRKQGIMQNLTVVSDQDGYKVIIGHRRMAAAKEAGLKELPCIIRDLDEKKQFEIMMEENMQRQDLTVAEQAYGFQMMFDWGYSVKDIADKTGFSETTVNHRLQIAKLDKNTLQKRQQENGEYMQLSISDLYKLESIKNIKKRNEILKDARDSSDLQNRVNNYNREIKKEKTKKEITDYLKKQGGILPATKQVENGRYSAKYDRVGQISYEDDNWEKEAETIIRKMDRKKTYWVYQSYWSAEIYALAEKKKKEETEYDRIQKRGKKLREIKKAGDMYMRHFIRDAVTEKLKALTAQQIQNVIEFCWWMIKNKDVDLYLRTAYAKVIYDSSHGYYTLQEDKKKGMVDLDLWKGLLIMCGNYLEDKEIFTYPLKHRKEVGEAYTEFTDVLGELWGFEWPDDEIRTVIDGTHELFQKEGEK